MQTEHVNGEASSFVGHETSHTEAAKKAAPRKILVVAGGAVHEFDTKSEAGKYINQVGAAQVEAVYTGAKPSQLKTKVTL